MAIREIKFIPEKCLRTVCAPVTVFDDALADQARDMLDTMYDAPGIGLAACQIGVLNRVVTIDVAKEEMPKVPLIFINPEITSVSEELGVYEEGCLSIPEYYEEVERPVSCTVSFVDLDGAAQTMACEGLLATAIQHEVDHLNGKLFIDHISRLKRERITKKFSKMAKISKRNAS